MQKGKSPLMVASFNKTVDTLKLLLAKGAHVDTQDIVRFLVNPMSNFVTLWHTQRNI